MSQNSVDKTRLGKAVTSLGVSAWVLLSLFGLSTAVLWIIFQFVPESITNYLGNTTPGILFLTALQYVVTFAIVIGAPLLIRRNAKHDSEELKKLLGIATALRLRYVLLVPLVWPVYFLVTNIAALLATMVPGFDVNQVQDVGFSNLTSLSDLVLAFIGLVVLAPIAEELLFRGYLFGKIRAISSFWPTAIIVSLVFGFAHLQWNVGIDVFILSLFLCWLREKTGSIWTSMMLHGLKNAIAYFILFVAPFLGINLLQ